MRYPQGESLPDAGDAAFGTGVTTGYLEQNARLDPSLDIYATMRLVFTPALDAMKEMDVLQKQLAADPHNAELTDKIAHCTAVIDAMDAYNMDTQIKKVLNGMGFPADRACLDDRVRAAVPQSGLSARHRGFFASVAHLGV